VRHRRWSRTTRRIASATSARRLGSAPRSTTSIRCASSARSSGVSSATRATMRSMRSDVTAMSMACVGPAEMSTSRAEDPRAGPEKPCPRRKHSVCAPEGALPSPGGSTRAREGSTASTRGPHGFDLEAPLPSAAVALPTGVVVLPSTQAGHARDESSTPLDGKQHVRGRRKRSFHPWATLLRPGSTSRIAAQERCPRAWPSCPRPKRVTPAAEAVLPSMGSSTCEDAAGCSTSDSSPGSCTASRYDSNVVTTCGPLL
jgi:hypothetical protein